MKKACVVSSYAYIDTYINYGALLQYYALEKALKKKGIESYWLKYKIKDDISTKEKIKKITKFILFYKKNKEIEPCISSFKQFIDRYCNVSEEEYYSNAEIKKNLPIADIYITGSDQVWGGTQAPNYLAFVPDNLTKISYAASFGKNEISEKQKKIIMPWLKRLDYISVREDTGVEICRSMGINAVQVLDPTLLIDAKDYPTIQKCECPDVYGYFLNFDYLDQIYWHEILNFTNANKYSLRVACVNQTLGKYPKKYRDLPTPEEWLTKYERAKYIITNTFHGTIFAIIFHRPFLVIKQKGEGAKQNGRVESLLKSLGLENRYFDERRSIDEQVNKYIDWKSIDEKLTILRNKSNDFLYKIIKE